MTNEQVNSEQKGSTQPATQIVQTDGGHHFTSVTSNVKPVFCPSCGKQLPASGKFCVGCGAPIAEGVSINRDMANKLSEGVRNTSSDALKAFLTFMVNPMGGIKDVYDSLGHQRAMYVGIAFGVIFALLVAISGNALSKQLSEWLSFLSFVGIDIHMPENLFFRLFLIGLIPPCSLFMASLLSRLAFRGTATWEGDVFLAGSAVVPFAVTSLISDLLGSKNIEIILGLIVFALCFLVLILYSGCTRISKISEKGATIAVPLMMIFSLYIASILARAILK